MSLLRGRFLRTERTIEDERPPSVAASELLQLRQRNTVSGLREGFRSGLETGVRGQASSDDSETSIGDQGSEFPDDQAQYGIPTGVQVWNFDQLRVTQFTNNIINVPHETSVVITGEENAIQRGDWQEQVTGDEQRNLLQSNFAELDQWRANHQESLVGDWQGFSGNALQRTAHGNDGEELNNLPGQQIWPDDGSRATLGSWSGGRSNPPRTRHDAPIRRIDRFHPPDDDNVYSIELRELLSRRSVLNLLHSGFRESLDQLIQSYVERQGRAPVDWDLHRNLPTSAASLHDPLSQPTEPNVGTVNRPAHVLPSPPVPPPQPLWRQGLHHADWSRHGMHRSELELEMMNDLRADVARLQQE